MRKLKGFWRLLRFELPFSAGMCVVMGQLLALGNFSSIYLTSFGFLSIFLISASILVLNDYFDVETDRINAPERALPSGLVSTGEALALSISLLATGFVFSYLIGFVTLIIAVVLSIIGLFYNRKFKKSGLAGNLMVSFSVGMTFAYGAMSVGLPFNKAALFYGLIAALIDLGEEISADAMDIKGDTLINSSSLAIKYGKQAALKISAGIFSWVIILSIIPFLLKWFEPLFILPIAIMDTSIAYYAYRLLKSKNEEGRKYIRRLYLGATAGILIFLGMKLAQI